MINYFLEYYLEIFGGGIYTNNDIYINPKQIFSDIIESTENSSPIGIIFDDHMLKSLAITLIYGTILKLKFFETEIEESKYTSICKRKYNETLIENLLKYIFDYRIWYSNEIQNKNIPTNTKYLHDELFRLVLLIDC